MDVNTQAIPAAGSPTGAKAEKLISFELRGHRCCVNASAVAEVVHSLQAAALPDQPSWLVGLAAYRGEPVAVIDPSVLAAGPVPAAPGRRSKTIIFRNQTDTDALRYALPIDSLQEMIVIEPGRLPSTGDLPVADLDLSGVRHKLVDPGLLFQHLAAASRY